VDDRAVVVPGERWPACLFACLLARCLENGYVSLCSVAGLAAGRVIPINRSGVDIYFTFSFFSLLVFLSSLLFSFPSSPFYAPGPSARASLVPPCSRPNVRTGEQEGPQILRYRDVALHRRRGHCHVFLQVSFCLSRSDVTINQRSLYVHDDVCR